MAKCSDGDYEAIIEIHDDKSNTLLSSSVPERVRSA